MDSRLIRTVRLRFYGQQFYELKKKVIPALIERMLAPLSLAIWFMDDGSRKSAKHKTYIIHSLGYSKDDLLRVQTFCKRIRIESSSTSSKRTILAIVYSK